MQILTIMGDFKAIYNSIKDFFINIWNDIQNFLLQYFSQNVLNVFIMGLLLIIILFIILAIMNKN